MSYGMRVMGGETLEINGVRFAPGARPLTVEVTFSSRRVEVESSETAHDMANRLAVKAGLQAAPRARSWFGPIWS